MAKYICPKCSKSRWKTLIKGKKYKCRNCGHIQEGTEVMSNG